jgi:NAD(P)-dependent dehydrogenase (short-subunit alcohol dehydrogenase family)
VRSLFGVTQFLEVSRLCICSFPKSSVRPIAFSVERASNFLGKNRQGAVADAALRANTLERIAALHRIGEPMEVAGAVVLLVSPRRVLDHRRDDFD